MSSSLISTSRTLTQVAADHVAQKFGMFIHYGMSTYTNTDQASYTDTVNTFAPTNLDSSAIAQWAQTCVTAKMKFAVLTARHSGGFCLWNTAVTAYNITATSWYASSSIDIVGEFCNQMRAHGVVPFLYILNYDQHFENVTNVGFTQADYRAHNEACIRELMSNYGRIGGIWMDGAEWNYSNTPYPWDTAEQRADFVHGLQRNALFINNAHFGGLTTSDVVTYEYPTGNGLIPGGNSTVAEQCEPIRQDGTWFWNSTATTPQSASYILNRILTSQANDGCYLLDCPPDTTGLIGSDIVSVLTTVGAGL